MVKRLKARKQKKPPKEPTFVPTDKCKYDDESLEEMLERLGIENWDWLIVGDGSGSNWGYQVGWGCTTVERVTMEKLPWFGSMNRGTVNFAEMMAYLQPLNWISAREDERRAHGRRRRIRRVHIITDSEYCRNQGRSDDLMPRKNGALWRIFDDYQRHGLLLHWHWRPRTDVALNVYADGLSKAARYLLKKHDVQRMVEQDEQGQVVRTIYDYNPI